jgi:hypothetical protein
MGLIDAESAMSEAEFDRTQDGAQRWARVPEAEFSTHWPLSHQPLEAANDNHRTWSLIPFPPDWYVTCLGRAGDTGLQPQGLVTRLIRIPIARLRVRLRLWLVRIAVRR